jgi:tetratricopeptide (TPR) repeat protein
MSKQQDQDNLSRRETIKLLMAIPAATFGLTQSDKLPMLQEDEVVSLCAVNVPLAWRLYFAGGLADVKQLLPTYIAQLSNIAVKPTRYGKQAAALASQAHQLGYLVALQNQDYGTALTEAQYAFHHAEIAEDANLQVASLIRQANLYHTLKRPTQTLQRYQKALQYSDKASSLLKGQAYIGLAEAYASSHEEQQALYYKGLAKDTFPQAPEDDIHFAYTHFNHFTLTNFEGLMYLHLDQPKQAWESFGQISKAIPTSLVPQRVELLSRQATTSVMLKEMEQSCTLVELAVTSALKLGSNLRFNEASETYEAMRVLWPNEPKVKTLDELFQA